MVLASSRLTFGAALAASGFALVVTASARVIARIASAARAARSTLRLASFRFAAIDTAAWSFTHEIIVAIPLIIWVVDEFSLTGGVAFGLVTCELGIVIIIYLA